MIAEKTCCFSGHRKIPKYELNHVLSQLKPEIERLIEQGITTFISGGAMGFDLMAASAVIILRDNDYPHIKLVFALPCEEHMKYWNNKEMEFFNHLRKEANGIIYTSEHYFNGCMHIRNRYMVDNSSYCICYLTKETGGTAYTVDYAKKNRLTVFNTAKERKGKSPF